MNLIQMTIISTTVGKNPLEKWSSLHSQQKGLKCSTWVLSQKRQNNPCFWGKPFNITVIQVYVPTTYAKKYEVEQFCEDLRDLLELTPEKDVLFIIRDWSEKVGSQGYLEQQASLVLECKMKQGKTNRVLPREHTGHSKHPFPTTQKKTLHMDTTRWSVPKSDWLYFLQLKMEKHYTVRKNKTRTWLWLRSWTLCFKIQT